MCFVAGGLYCFGVSCMCLCVGVLWRGAWCACSVLSYGVCVDVVCFVLACMVW